MTASIVLDKTKWEREPNAYVVVLRGIDESIDAYFLQLYAENLVINDDATNDVDKIERSKLMRDVVYITFKKPVDEQKVRGRVQKRPKLNTK